MTRQEMEVCWEIKKEIERRENRVRELKELLEVITVQLTGLPKSRSLGSRIDKLTAAIIDFEKEIEALKAVRAECQIELDERLAQECNSEPMRQVLFCRYGLCLKFREIEKVLHYSSRQIYKMHSVGIKKVQHQCSNSAVTVQYQCSNKK